MVTDSQTFYDYVLKLVSLDCNLYDTMFESKTFFTADELKEKVWGHKSGSSNRWFKEFENLGLIKRGFDKEEKKIKCFIDVKSIIELNKNKIHSIKEEVECTKNQKIAIHLEILKKIKQKEPIFS